MSVKLRSSLSSVGRVLLVLMMEVNRKVCRFLGEGVGFNGMEQSK